MNPRHGSALDCQGRAVLGLFSESPFCVPLTRLEALAATERRR